MGMVVVMGAGFDDGMLGWMYVYIAFGGMAYWAGMRSVLWKRDSLSKRDLSVVVMELNVS